MKYAARRLLHTVLLLAALSILSFVFASLAPGDFFSEMGMDARVTAGTLDSLRVQSGLDRPLPVRYVRWLGSVARGEFGYSLAYRTTVGGLLKERIPGTLLLTATATLVAWAIALPLGVWLAARRGRWQDHAVQAVLALLLSVPELLTAIVLLALAARTGWLPAGGAHSPGWEALPLAGRVRDTLRHLAIPVTVLVLGMLPILTRHVRAAIAEVLDAPFALAARAHGIPRARRLLRHLLPAALNPLISLFGFSLGTLLSGSLLVEVLVGWPGLGPLFLEAVLARDLALALGVIMMSACFLSAGNFCADLMLYRADPRIRLR